MKKILVLFAIILISSFSIINFILFPLEYKNIIIQYSAKYNLDSTLIASLINAESNFNKNAVSHKGAIGLMQILPSTGKWIYSELYTNSFNEEILKLPEVNIELGCFYINYLYSKFDNLTCVLCAYNAGETVVRKWLNDQNYSNDAKTLKNIPYKETLDYVKKIENYIKVYSLKFN